MKKILFIALIGYGAFNWYQQHDSVNNGYSYGEPHDQLIMYSLTTCGYCKLKVKQLKQENIAFTEFFIDLDSKRREELFTKLNKSGYPSRNIGTPTFDAHGTMLPNNPDMSVIKTVLLNTEME
ncbi:MAG: glutaredoxin [Methylophagaceae bacterium]|jgi:glutaredoxin